MQHKVFTLVHKNFKTDNYISMLETYEIGTIIDLRSIPYAKHITRNFTSVRKKCISHSIQRENILNTNLGKFFTLDLLEANHLNDKGILDTRAFINSELFQRAILTSLKNLKNTSILFLCSEADPLMYNRTLLFSEYFRNYGYEVVHLKLWGIHDQNEEYKYKLSTTSKLKVLSKLNKQRIATIDNYIKLNKNITYTKLQTLDTNVF